LIARAGQSSGTLANGGAAGNFSTFGDPALAARGQVAFRATLTGATDASNAGIYLADASEIIPVVRNGQRLGATNVLDITFRGGPNRGGRSGLNDNGQVAFEATLTNGQRGVYVFTPELRYRSNSNGNWDTASNWTVGLKPADVHDVVINPSATRTVTGPAADVTVKSLRIGASTTGASAILSLSQGGDLTAGRLSVLSTGRINVTAGVLRTSDFDNIGTIELSKALIVDYEGESPLSLIREQIINGTNGASAIGPNIRGPVAAGRAVGYAEASDVLTFTGGLASFEGQTVDDTTLLIRYTLRGDADLDGVVSFPDLLVTSTRFGTGDGEATWSMGDFNHDGLVNFPDLLDVSTQYGRALAAAEPVSVPEPGGAYILPMIWVISRRCRRRIAHAKAEVQ
jgi:hypothetical protein